MPTVDTVVIGAGHAGLAVSRLLTEAGRDHVVLDRGRVGERWRTERWDSLHLLTPNWMTRLPGQPYRGSDSDAFMSASAFVRYLERYAASFDAPVVQDVTVQDLAAASDAYRVMTDTGTWHTRHVVIATGPHGVAQLPSGLHADEVVTANQYRNPSQLPPGGVLIIGASASGVQIADELNRAGREVILAVGRHTRVPRSYRGMDIFWWLESTGRLARTIDEFPDASVARREPSLQLAGRALHRLETDVDLVALQARGVRLVGRFAGTAGSRLLFRPDLAANAAVADARLYRLLDAIDEYVARTGLTHEVLPPSRPSRLDVPAATQELGLTRGGIGTVLVAAGYRTDHRWLRLPIIESSGHIAQHRGVTGAPGVYVVGQRFQHRRDSGFIDGARRDARTVVQHLLTGSLPAESGPHHAKPAS